MTLLQQISQTRERQREQMRTELLLELRNALQEIVPGLRVIVFGSLLKPGRFNATSDVDLAIEGEPPGITIYRLSSLLGERFGRRVDVVLLPECRFRDRILREGEIWMPRD